MAKDQKPFDESEIVVEQTITPDEIEGLDELHSDTEEIETEKVWHDGKRVYRQVMTDFGTLPNTTAKTKDFPVTVPVGKVSNIVSYNVITDNGSSVYYQNSFATTDYTIWGIDLSATNLRVICSTDWNASSATADSIIVEYTRTDK